METQKAKVGLLGLMLDLYDLWPELKVAEAAFAQELAETLSPFAEVEFPGVCNSREQVDAAVRAFEAGGKDLILVVLLTYAPSHIALQPLIRTPLPVLIFNTQQLYQIDAGTSSDATTRNHGMHGVQDLTNVLNGLNPENVSCQPTSFTNPDDKQLAKLLLKETSSDVLNNISFFTGFSFLF